MIVLDEGVDLRLLQTNTLRGFGVGSEEVHDKLGLEAMIDLIVPIQHKLKFQNKHVHLVKSS